MHQRVGDSALSWEQVGGWVSTPVQLESAVAVGDQLADAALRAGG